MLTAFAVNPTVSTARTSTIELTGACAVNVGFTKCVSNANDVFTFVYKHICTIGFQAYVSISFLNVGTCLVDF